MSNDTTPATVRGSDSSEGLGGFTLQEVAAFLDGSAPLDGLWFGELPTDGRTVFWWREHLRAALEAAPQRVPLTDDEIAARNPYQHSRNHASVWEAGFRAGVRAAGAPLNLVLERTHCRITPGATEKP